MRIAPTLKSLQFCPVCGTQDKEWDTILHRGSTVILAHLKPNQCVMYGSGHNDHTLCTHRCKGARAES
jgi:hypothetical protein